MSALSTREYATVEYIKRDDERGPTIYIGLVYEGGSRGFGGLILEPPLMDDWIKSVTDLFGVDDIECIVGRNCFALRSWPGHWNRIEGIEVDGRRLTVTGFRRKHFADVPDPLEEERQRIQREIDFNARRIREHVKSLQTLHEGYVDWSAEGSK